MKKIFKFNRKMEILSLLGIVLFVMSFANVSAIQNPETQVVDSTEVSLTEDLNRVPVALEFPYNMPVSLSGSSEHNIDVNGTTLDNDTSPKTFLSMSLNWNNNPYEDPYGEMNWLWVDNNTEIDGGSQNGSLNMKMKNLGDLPIGEKKDFSVNWCPFEWYVLTADLTPGVYSLIIYEMQDLNIQIVDPNNKVVPDTKSTSSERKTFFADYDVFVTQEKGIHYIYFQNPITTGPNYNMKEFSLELLKYTGNSVGYNQRIHNKESDVVKNVVEYESQLARNMPMNVYELEVEKDDYLQIDYLDWGSTLDYFAYPTECDSMNWFGLADSDNYNYIHIPKSGKAYLFFYNPDFYLGDGIGYTEYQNFLFEVNKVDKQAMSLDSTETLKISPENRVILELEITETTAVVMNSSTEGSSMTTSGLYMLDCDGSSDTLTDVFDCPPSSPYTTYILCPGTYYLWVNNGHDCDPGTYSYTTQRVNISQPLSHKSYNSNKEDVFSSDLDTIDFTPFNVEGGGNYYPRIFPINITSEIQGWGYNISWLREDNYDVFGDNATRFGGVQANLIFKSEVEGTCVGASDLTDIQGNSPGDSLYLDDASTENETSFATMSESFEDHLGWLVIQPYEFEIDNGSNWYRYNDTITMRAGTGDNKPSILRDNYGTATKGALDLSDFNSGNNDPYNTSGFYSFNYEYNATEYDALILKINGTQDVDWYQLIIRTNNSNSFGARVITKYNPWTSKTTRSEADGVLANIFNLATDNFNSTTNFGALSSEFYLLVEFEQLDSSLDAQLWIEVRSYGADMLSPRSFEVKPGLNVVGIAVGSTVGGLVLIGGAWYWFKKKR